MNYIELFMKHNFIFIGEKFAIKGSKKYTGTDKVFYINDGYHLKSNLIKRDHNSIFTKLLSGDYSVVIDIKED